MTQTCTDMTDIPTLFFIVSQSQACEIKKQKRNDQGRLSHICVKLTLSTVSFVSQSYDMTHITANSNSSVSMVSITRHLASQSYRSQFDWFGAVILVIPVGI